MMAQRHRRMAEVEVVMVVAKRELTREKEKTREEAATATVAKACVAHNALCGTFENSNIEARLEQGFRLFPSDRRGRFRQFWTGRADRQ